METSQCLFRDISQAAELHPLVRLQGCVALSGWILEAGVNPLVGAPRCDDVSASMPALSRQKKHQQAPACIACSICSFASNVT